MKQFRFLNCLLVVVLCLGVVSCSDDDDDDDGNKNAITYDSTPYDIDGEYVLNWGDDGGDGIYNLDLNLYTKGISFDESEEDFVGTGKMIQVEMWTSSAEFTAGTYTYNSNDNDAGTFSYLGFGDENGEIAAFTAGTVTVAKSGDNYTIVIAGTNDAGKSISVFYNGTLKKHNMTIWM